MLLHKFVGQPGGGTVKRELLTLIGSGQFASMAAAVAYVTVAGTSSLLPGAPRVELEGLDKRWLVGIDWFRSDPMALAALFALAHSQVRVFDGAAVVQRGGCVPRRPFHPKVWIFEGPRSRALVTGSANLSGNGLSRGHEADTVTLVSDPSTPAERSAWEMVGDSLTWFNGQWRSATRLTDIESNYAREHAAQQVKQPTPTEDDAVESAQIGSSTRRFSRVDLMRLRSSRHFWVQAGNLSHNRGPGNPGNQVMLRQFSRVFFGFLPSDVPVDTFIGYLNIEIGGVEHADRTLRYSNNSMDVLTVPVPGINGAPPRYDNETLLFRRLAGPEGRVRFRMSLAGAGDEDGWRRRSQAVDGFWRMPVGGREFGVF